MPQLDISAWPPQLIWLAISFVLLYIVVSKLIIPKTGGVIEARKSQVESDLAAAARGKEESEKALKAYEASLADARAKAQGVTTASRAKVAAESDAASAKLNADLGSKQTAAEKQIAASKTKALSGLHDMAGDLASEIVAELTGNSVAKTVASAAVAKLAN